ncbi:MAG: glycosyltransferase family 9 protein [Thermodesulfobacteriota bacterium]
MRILIVKLSAVGDVTQALACLNALRQGLPHAHLSWLVEEAAADLLVGHPQLDRLLVLPRKSWLKRMRRPDSWACGLAELLHGVAGLRAEAFDAILDLQAALKASLPIRLCRAGRIIGHRGADEMTEIFLTERLPAFDREQHAVWRYLDLARHLGAATVPVRFVIPAGTEVEAAVDRLLADHGLDQGRPLVAINPMAKWDSKLWPLSRFAAVATRLTTELGAAVVFTGGPEDQGAIASIQGQMATPAPSLAGRTSLRQLAELYRRCRLVVSTDTGPMHMAAAVERPVVAIFGPTAPWRTGPFGPGHRVLRPEGLACAPCFKRVCRQPACMEATSVEMVVQAAAEVLFPWSPAAAKEAACGSRS